MAAGPTFYLSPVHPDDEGPFDVVAGRHLSLNAADTDALLAYLDGLENGAYRVTVPGLAPLTDGQWEAAEAILAGARHDADWEAAAGYPDMAGELRTYYPAGWGPHLYYTPTPGPWAARFIATVRRLFGLHPAAGGYAAGGRIAPTTPRPGKASLL